MVTAACRLAVSEGIHCAGCVARLERTMAGVPGVRTVRASLASREVALEYDPAATSPAGLVAALARHGFTAQPLDQRPADDGPRRLRQARRRALAALALAAPLLAVGMGPAMHDLRWHAPAALLAAAILAGPGRGIIAEGVAGLVRGRFAMDALVALSALTALAVSLWLTANGHHHVWYESAGMTVALVLLGRWLEERARHATGAAVEALLARQPATALVVEDGGEREAPVAAVLPGMRLRLRPGMAVPCDGIVAEGAVEVDESAFTGEPLPVLRGPGARVAAGTLAVAGTAVMAAGAVGADTALARTAALVRAAQDAKPPLARLADRVAAVFVPTVLALAAATAAAWWLLGHGDGRWAAGLIACASVLAVACPCALGLATPTAIAVAAGRAAAAGMLVRDGAALERAAAVDAVVLDKTGTLTSGRPAVVEVLPADGRERVLALAAAVERGSPHPLARAIADACPAAPPSADLVVHPGLGAEAVVDGAQGLAGSAALLAAHGVALPGGLPEPPPGATVVHIAHRGRWCGRIACRDSLRPGAAAAVAALRAAGCRVLLASGDQPAAVAAVAAATGIGESHPGCSPEVKQALVEHLRGEGRVVAMVGDGVNDAPALAAADLGVAIGTGTDVAVQAGMVVLPGDDLAAVPALIALSRRTLATVRANLALAAGYNLVAIPLAAGAAVPLGIAPDPMWAAAAMAGSSLAVVGNSLRLRR